jgi:hypothetical protein
MAPATKNVTMASAYTAGSDDPDWYPLIEARREFGTKFQEEDVAQSFFVHALASGFIRSRYEKLTPLPNHQPSDDLQLEGHVGPEIPSFWWSLFCEDEQRTNLRIGQACFGNFWGQPCAVAEAIDVYRPNVVRLVSRKGVGGRPLAKHHWQRMTMHVVDIVRNGDLDRFASYAEFKNDLLDAIGDSLSDRAVDGPARQLWEQYQRSQTAR